MIALVVAVGLIAASAALAYAFTVHRYANNLTRVPGVIDEDSSDRPTPHPGVEAQNWLVVGSDSRAARGTSGREAKEPLWRPGMQRTDTIMLVHLAGDGRHVSVTSIPRDSWVPIPGHGTAKINAAFSYGGPALLVRTVEQLTNVHIDHYAAIDFAGFKTMTDAVGGVTVTIPRTVYDSANDKTWTKGRHHLDGAEALLYVRQRHGLPHGDLDRIGRQQTFLLALLDTVRSKGTLTHPLRLDAFLDAATESITVDDSVRTGELRDLVLRYRDVGADDMRFFTAPVRGSGRERGQAVLYLDKAKSAALFTALREDRVGAYVRGGGTTNKVDVPN